MILLFLFSLFSSFPSLAISGSVQQPPPPFSPLKGRQIEKVSGLHCSFAYYGRFVGRQAGRQAEHLTERTPVAHCTAPHKPDRPSTSHTTRTHKHILFLLAFVFLSLPPLPRNSCGKLETFPFFLLFLLSFTFPHNPYPPPPSLSPNSPIHPPSPSTSGCLYCRCCFLTVASLSLPSSSVEGSIFYFLFHNSH